MCSSNTLPLYIQFDTVPERSFTGNIHQTCVFYMFKLMLSPHYYGHFWVTWNISSLESGWKTCDIHIFNDDALPTKLYSNSIALLRSMHIKMVHFDSARYSFRGEHSSNKWPFYVEFDALIEFDHTLTVSLDHDDFSYASQVIFRSDCWEKL